MKLLAKQPESEKVTLLRNRLKLSINRLRIEHQRRMQLVLLGREQFDTDPHGGDEAERVNVTLSGTLLEASIGSASSATGSFPWYPNLAQVPQDYLKANDMLKNFRVLLSQTRAVDIEPNWRGCENDLIQDARTQWWRFRAQGLDGFGAWKDDLDRSFGDFAEVGLGALRVSLEVFSDGSRVAPVWYSPLDVQYDPYAKHPEDSEEVIFATNMSLEKAQVRWPDYDWANVDGIQMYLSTEGLAAKGVRVLEYYHSRGKDDDIPGYIAFLRDYDGPLLETDDNPFDFLPVQFFTGLIPPGGAFPVGLVQMQLYDQTELWNEERHIKRTTNEEGGIAYVPGWLEPSDVAKMERGEIMRFYRVDSQSMTSAIQAGVKSPFFEIPRVPVSKDHWQRLEARRRSLQMNSATTDNAAGVQTATGQPVTATESAQMGAGQAAQVNFFTREFARGMIALAVKLAKAARMETAPFVMTFQNTPIVWNGDDKRLTTKSLFAGPISCLIGDEQLTTTDAQNKEMRAAQNRMAWLTALSTPNFVMNESALVAYGESLGISNPGDDVQKAKTALSAVQQPQPAPGTAPAGGAPMQ